VTTLDDGIQFVQWVEVSWSRITDSPDPHDPHDFEKRLDLLTDRPDEERFVGPSVWLRMALHNDRLEVDEVRVVRRAGDPEISLPDIPLSQMVNETTRETAGVVELGVQLAKSGSIDIDSVERAADSALATRRRRTVNDKLLQEVAEVYQADTTYAPTWAVANHFPTSHRTATRYVALARKRGFLPPYGEDQS
jgi:hypothetical protein